MVNIVKKVNSDKYFDTEGVQQKDYYSLCPKYSYV
jgi:hypothetical protein